MSTFNFDSESNVTNSKIPSAKAINKNFCGVKNTAGLWIADENMDSCGWRKSCSNCSNDCVDHFVNTKHHVIDLQSGDEVSGRGIMEPRIIVLRRTKLLRLTNDKNTYAGYWRKGDGEIKDDKGQKKYSCVRRYLIVFVDENNRPLHEDPIQLTAKGYFQMEFDNALMKFRSEITIAYNKVMKRRGGNMNDQWYAMCVFAPTFESKLVGKAPLTSFACVIKCYTIPTEQNWLTMCVGRNMEINEIINLKFLDSEQWINKWDRTTTINTENDFETSSSVSDY